MAFVRSRHGGGSDWLRLLRQQIVLIALLPMMAQPNQILKLPSLMQTLGASVTADFPADKVADYVAQGQGVPSTTITQVILGPPYTTGISNSSGRSRPALDPMRSSAQSVRVVVGCSCSAGV